MELLNCIVEPAVYICKFTHISLHAPAPLFSLRRIQSRQSFVSHNWEVALKAKVNEDVAWPLKVSFTVVVRLIAKRI
jgi:hypothetical protein